MDLAKLSDYEGDPEALIKLQELCKTNLEFLYREICGYDRWNTQLHGDYPGDPENHRPPGLAYYLNHSGPRKLILIPRNHLKSTVVTVVWSIQRILINPNTRILINNAKYDTAREFVSTIQAHLDTGSKLSKIFGDFRSPRLTWNRDSFTIAQRTIARAQPTVMAASLETTLNGKHFDLIINDDLVEPNNVNTKDQLNKVINFHKDCFNQIDKGGIIVDIGTRWASQDLYGHILNTSTQSINGVKIEKGQGAEWYKFVDF